MQLFRLVCALLCATVSHAFAQQNFLQDSGSFNPVTSTGTITSGTWNGTAISNSSLANMTGNTVKCNATGSPASPQDCTLPSIGIPTFYPVGALCNGVHDDTSNFQAAINAADANAPWGGYVPVPGQNCLLTATLTTTGYAHIRGTTWFHSELYRTGNYGDTITCGTSSVACAQGFEVDGVWFQHGAVNVATDVTTSASTLSSGTTLFFAAPPANVIAGWTAYDATTGNALGTVSSIGGNNVVMSAAVGFAVGSGDQISFGVVNLPNLATSGAHIRIWGGNAPKITRNNFVRMQYGLAFMGGSLFEVEHNLFRGIWDNRNTGAQEGIANVVFIDNTAFGNPTSLRWTDNDTLNVISASRTVTYTASDGTKTITRKEYLGSKYGILAYGLEDASIKGGLIGGQNVASIAFLNDSTGTTIGPRIVGVQFDGTNGSTSNSCDIIFQSGAAGKYTLNASIVGNEFNGEGTSLHAICVVDGGFVSAYNMTITGNTFGAYVGTPIFLSGLTGANITGNAITNYNYYNTSPTGADCSFAAAACVYDLTTYTAWTGNSVGGGGNTYSQGVSRYTYNGIVLNGATNTQCNTINLGVPSSLGAMSCTGGVTFSGAVTASGNFSTSGNYSSSVLTSSLATLDVSTTSGFTTTLGGNVALAPAGTNYSIVFISDVTITGAFATYQCGNGTCSLISPVGTFVASTTSPASSKYSVAYNGTAYAVYNNNNASAVFKVAVIKLN